MDAALDRLVVVAVDVGGTSLKAGAFGPAGLQVLRRLPSGRQRGPAAVLDEVASVVAALIEESGDRGLDVAGVGVAVPGIVDGQGVGRMSVTMGWRDLPVRQFLSERYGRPVTVGHDVRSAAVAEATFGAASGTDSALFVPIGTGLAAAVVLGGVIHPGATFRAGEIGQVIVAPGTTLEGVASAHAIAERYAAAAGLAPGSVDASDVVARLAADDDIAAGVWSAAVEALAGVLATAVATLDVEVLVLGGGLSRCGATLTAPLHAAMAAALPWRELPRIVTARFGADAGFVGVALEAWRGSGRDVVELAAAVAASTWDAAGEAAPR